MIPDLVKQWLRLVVAVVIAVALGVVCGLTWGRAWQYGLDAKSRLDAGRKADQAFAAQTVKNAQTSNRINEDLIAHDDHVQAAVAAAKSRLRALPPVAACPASDHPGAAPIDAQVVTPDQRWAAFWDAVHGVLGDTATRPATPAADPGEGRGTVSESAAASP